MYRFGFGKHDRGPFRRLFILASPVAVSSPWTERRSFSGSESSSSEDEEVNMTQLLLILFDHLICTLRYLWMSGIALHSFKERLIHLWPGCIHSMKSSALWSRLFCYHFKVIVLHQWFSLNSFAISCIWINCMFASSHAYRSSVVDSTLHHWWMQSDVIRAESISSPSIFQSLGILLKIAANSDQSPCIPSFVFIENKKVFCWVAGIKIFWLTLHHVEWIQYSKYAVGISQISCYADRIEPPMVTFADWMTVFLIWWIDQSMFPCIRLSARH